ncbi:MAG: tRNA (N6-isopentenyl adenosine(37)-C2)-methylthiotransferase MiaB [Synergistaceae bacterium]|nr:tRNA (N6-isopentenyl adenosine(37)-C2)-methylthiotransferase MiaB [Synergistaceae bacterium]
MHRFSIRVFGCQMNSYDGDRLRTALLHEGWLEASEEEADVVLLVTCSIREKAEQKVASEIGRYEAMRRAKGRPAVALVGCMAQRIGVEMAKRFSCVRLVSGPRHLGLVPRAVTEIGTAGTPRFFMDDDPRALTDLEVVPTARTNPFKAYVTITYGCDRFCSYCIVPYVRGRLQSRSAKEILKETQALIDCGAREITLLGQNVDAYGKDLEGGVRFASLLADVAAQPGLERLRFVTSHPKDFDEDILDVMRGNPVICRAINLPVQAGSDRILREMNRGYSSGEYLELVRKIRAALPDVSLTTDLIVGFPGETDEDFRASYKLLEEVAFDIVHTAAYSPREGTRAAMMDCQIENSVKAARLNEINALQARIARAVNEAYIGRELEILADGYAPRGEGKIQGRTMSDKVVIIPGSQEDFGKVIPVRIVRASHWSLEGERRSSL